MKDMILGSLDQAGGQAYLLKLSKTHPPAYASLLGKLLPHTMRIEHPMPSEEELATMTPLDILKWTMRASMHAALVDPTRLTFLADAANKAAQYEHPKLASIEHKGSLTLEDMTVEQLGQLAAALRQAAEPRGIESVPVIIDVEPEPEDG
jgi:hypothetical protein